MTREGIVYTGRNGDEVRRWVDEDAGRDPSETWFITRGMSASTGGQSWRYVRENGHMTPWGDKVRAAVYDARNGQWWPVKAGDVVERQGSGHGVRGLP